MGDLIKNRITVREFINLLLDEPMENEIGIFQDGKKVDNAEIRSIKVKTLGALFG